MAAFPADYISPGRDYSLVGVSPFAIQSIIGFLGICSYVIFSIRIAGFLKPGEDAEEPLALLFAPIAVNICYTAGWIVDGILRLSLPSATPQLSPSLFKAGLAFSAFVVSIPAIFWSVYSLFHFRQLLR